MKTLLICHESDDVTRQALARWLASFSNLVGIIALRETKQRVLRRIWREVRRVGGFRFLDVVAFRVYYRFVFAKKDQEWLDEAVARLSGIYPAVKADVPILLTNTPNSADAEQFVQQLSPDLILARCKTLLKEKLFSLPSRGTFVMHPGVCPEYRNAHGCFWALASNDLNKVGMTLLKVDKGIDTGPVYGYYSYKYDEMTESHIRIQHRVVIENLTELKDRLVQIFHGEAMPLDTSGRASRTWGQPWLTSYLKWKYCAKRRHR